MKTADLIQTLAGDAGPAAPVAFAPRLLLAGLVGAGAAAVALVLWLGLRPLGEAVMTPPFWMKAAYTLVLSGAGFILLARLARPGGSAGKAPWLILAPLAFLAMLAAMQILRVAPAQLPRMWLGQSWEQCPFRILALALPTYFAAVWAMRRMAPTRLSLTGAAAGLFAGAVGATVYGLYCQETAALFVVTWYTLGVGACAALGALFGAHLLRW